MNPIAFFPEGAYGPANNCRACRKPAAGPLRVRGWRPKRTEIVEGSHDPSDEHYASRRTHADRRPDHGGCAHDDLARAKAFYGETLGLADANVPTPGPQVVYRCGHGTLLEVYERPVAGEAEHTLASREVSDLRAAVDQLRDRGVRFEEYDLPEVKTEDGISTTGGLREAWFRDPDGNILRIHSNVQT